MKCPNVAFFPRLGGRDNCMSKLNYGYTLAKSTQALRAKIQHYDWIKTYINYVMDV